MRVSTTQIFRNGISAIQNNQLDLTRTQLQLASGKRMLSPADDPTGAVQALQFRSGVEKTQQYQRNSDVLEHRLQLSEGTLAAVGEGLQRVRELALAGNNGTQSNETRRYLAGEIRHILDELLQLANTRDANGEYIYAGHSSLTQAFSLGAGGAVSYNGDDGQRQLQISPVRQVAIGDSGQRVFMDIPDGNGTFAVHDDPANTGGGVIDAGTVVDFAAWVPDDYTISFDEVDGELFYQVTDGGGATILGPVPFGEGEAIRFNGVETRILGTPKAGDNFSLRPSQNQDLFTTYRQLAEALEAPVTDDASRARLNNAVNRALVDLDQGLERVLEVRASLGARLQTVDSQRSVNEDVLLQLRTMLSNVEDLDYAEAISRFNLQQVALQAAQQTYVQVQRLSLFNFL
jgi:flagellar hook-associated protein 3 FlgL